MTRRIHQYLCLSAMMLLITVLECSAGENDASEEAKKPEKPQTGEMKLYPLTHRYHEKGRSYWQGKYRRKLKSGLKKHARRMERAGAPIPDWDAAVDYDVTKQNAHVLVPDAYAQKPDKWGIVIHLVHGNGGYLEAGWKPVLAKKKLIFASPHNAGAIQHPARRLCLALDCLATLQEAYDIDRERVYISGFNEASLIAVWAGLHWPDAYTGIISHGRGVNLIPMPGPRKNSYYPSDVNWLKKKYLGKIAEEAPRFAFVTAPKEANHNATLASIPAWHHYQFPYRVFDFPGQPAGRHIRPSGLALVLDWLDGKDVKGAEPDYAKAGFSFDRAVEAVALGLDGKNRGRNKDENKKPNIGFKGRDGTSIGIR